eukprot:12907680-Prorocentrum_lima.AAC.1
MNELFQVLAGDIRTLPHGGQWSGILLLQDDLVAVFSDEDLTCAFYLFRVAACVAKVPGAQQGDYWSRPSG